MYQLYVEKPNSFAPDLVGEFTELEDAQKKAKLLKEKNSEITYSIEETNGGFNSYGDLLTEVIERG